MFKAWIQSYKFRFLVQHLLAIIADDFIEMFFDIYNVT